MTTALTKVSKSSSCKLKKTTAPRKGVQASLQHVCVRTFLELDVVRRYRPREAQAQILQLMDKFACLTTEKERDQVTDQVQQLLGLGFRT